MLDKNGQEVTENNSINNFWLFFFALTETVY